MGKKILIYVAGIVTGVILTFLVAFILSGSNSAADDINCFESPISYEGKSTTSFEVFQVFGDCALAHEKEGYGYHGKIVLLVSDKASFYSDQVVEVKDPIQIGTYSYESKGGMPFTVPVIDVTQ